MLAVHRRQQADPEYFYVPELPRETTGQHAADTILEREASLA